MLGRFKDLDIYLVAKNGISKKPRAKKTPRILSNVFDVANAFKPMARQAEN